ncbi:ABC transporter substrate-binding protein [Bifidobacterium sp. ESL0800]|uniref:peptide ABC transporter substrate-binding protein n=1 Tax=Bifidobacterium sp. ESL0800 TaxID=2983236 RepID=UPI0023F908EC|nr:ABC transporter substrate-binding protein [Bifidobacterium sp. ESL0800]WEV75056.1 ABC transporter substrate-binding protein [Bifidobacterium sp. ESL0800]
MVSKQLGKRLAAAALAGATMVSMAACGSGQAKTANAKHGSTSSIISVNNTEPLSALVPADTNEMGGSRIIRYLFEGLVSFDAKGRQHMEVAKSITANADSTQYAIKLNDGWKFTNGEAVTAQSFAKAWSFAANAKHAQKQASRMSIIKGYDALQKPDAADDAQLSGLQTPDDHTLIVTLNAPDSVFPTQVSHQSFAPLPSVAYKDIKAFGKHPIGDGPYMFKSWRPNTSITVVKNPDYRGSRKVMNGGIEYRDYSSPDAAYADVQSGNLDLLMDVPQSALKTFRTDSTIKAYSQPGSVYMGIVIPERLAHFGLNKEGDLRRQAISMAIDRNQIIDKVFYNTKTAATDFTSPGVPEHQKNLKGTANLRHNAAKAKQLWKQADAISPFKQKLTISYPTDGGHKPWIEAVCNQLKNTLGVDAVADAYPTMSDMLKRVLDRSIQTPYFSGWSLDYPSAEDYMTPLYSSESADGHGTNNGDYKNPQFDAALLKAKSEKDVAKRTADFNAAQEILLNDLPAIPMWCNNVSAASSPSVGNVHFDYTNVPTYNTITK